MKIVTKIKTITIILSLLILIVSAKTLNAGNLYKISGTIRGLSGEHKVFISVFKNEDNFKNNLALQCKIFYPEKIKEGKIQYFFILPEGEYVIFVFEDKNNNNKFDTGGMFNLPKEPYGYYKHYSYNIANLIINNKPQFNNLKFKLKNDIINANINLIKP